MPFLRARYRLCLHSSIMAITPYQWMELVRDCALATLDASPRVDPPAVVEIGDMKTTNGSAGNCGALYVDGGALFEVGERFPDRISPSTSVAAFKGCAPGVAFPMTVRYMHCVPVFGDRDGSAPTSEQRAEFAELLWETAWDVWDGYACCIRDWKRTYGSIIRHQLTPLPRQGGISGFEISFTAALSTCATC